MSLKTSIGWTDMTCNPIKGKCKLGCWYCYYSGERGIAKRFKLDDKVSLSLQAFDKLPKAPKKVFLCSTHEIFGEWIPKEWRDEIFWEIENNFPQHTFQVLTKLPQNIDRAMPNNVWLGVSITGNDDQLKKGFDLFNSEAKIRFISFEPLLQPIKILDELWNFDWIIIGALTGHGKKYQPEKEWIQEIVLECRDYNIPVFLKDNLREIWGEPLIQEFPE